MRYFWLVVGSIWVLISLIDFSSFLFGPSKKDDSPYFGFSSFLGFCVAILGFVIALGYVTYKYW